jgi:hypothetical protein
MKFEKSVPAMILAVVFLSLLVVAISLPTSQKTAAEVSIVEEPGHLVSDVISGYRQWTRVNPVPALFHSQIAAMCAAPTEKQMKMETNNPHMDKFITVYVNSTGRRAMMEEKTPRFPPGSVIVKEKLATKDSSMPELLTVMKKREAGYDPVNGNWEYIALDGSGRTIQARGKLETCQACHLLVKDTDYVSRNYLPYEIWQMLK